AGRALPQERQRPQPINPAIPESRKAAFQNPSATQSRNLKIHKCRQRAEAEFPNREWKTTGSRGFGALRIPSARDQKRRADFPLSSFGGEGRGEEVFRACSGNQESKIRNRKCTASRTLSLLPHRSSCAA